MRSSITAQVRRLLSQQPPQVRQAARRAFQLFLQDPQHPRLHFKKVHGQDEVYSVRIDLNYRALATRRAEEVVWFWIGGHDEYERVIARLR